jgi:hypothetical protein
MARVGTPTGPEIESLGLLSATKLFERSRDLALALGRNARAPAG